MKCLHCDNEERSRGLCVTCYQSAIHRVRRGDCTWEWLEESGLVKRSSRRNQTPFTTAFEAKRDKR